MNLEYGLEEMRWGGIELCELREFGFIFEIGCVFLKVGLVGIFSRRMGGMVS